MESPSHTTFMPGSSGDIRTPASDSPEGIRSSGNGRGVCVLWPSESRPDNMWP